MCDQDHFEDDKNEFETRGMVTRRQFGVLLGAGVAMALPKVANAVGVTESDVTIKTPGGDLPATATLTDEGGKLSGTFGSPMGEVPVSGSLDGKVITLTMVAQTPQGAMNVAMTGDLAGDTIVNGKADVAGMGQMEWSAKRIKQ